MEKENLKNFSIIDNRGTDNPINSSCDNIIDKNGNIIYKCYNNIYKLTYRHIYKYKRITTISTDVIYDKNYNSYTPLYHYYYDDVNKKENLDEKKDYDDTDEITYYEKSTKQVCLKYDLHELLLLRFLNYDFENDSDEILNKNCFLKERKFSKCISGKFLKDRNNTNTLTNSTTTNNNSNITNNNITNNIRIRNTYTDDNSQVRNHSYSLNSVNNLNTKIFKNLDDKCYNLPVNNIYIDKEGKMHLTGQDFYNSNNNFNNKILSNKYDRSLNFPKKEKDLLMDFEYSDKINVRKNNSEKYWDNPSHYPKKNNYDIFTLGDIKKYSKNNEKQKNNLNLNDNSYSIFKDNEEENLTKSNFAKWFKNNNINVNENIDILKYLSNKNMQSDTDLKSNQKSFNINRNYENDIYNKNGNSFNIDITNTGSNEEKISNTVAELLIKQISMLKERKSMDNLEKRNSLGFFDTNCQSSSSINIDKNNLTEKELYSKEAGKKILEIFKAFNSNSLPQEQLEQQQSYINNLNTNYYNGNNKYYSMDNITYKKNFIDNYMNDGNNIDHLIMHKKSLKNKDILNNYNLQDNCKSSLNLNSFNNYNNINSSNIDNYAHSYNNFDSFKNKNAAQCNINITPIINSLLRLDNEYEYNDNKIPSNSSNYISESIQNAKVNNVLDSLKSLLKASKNQNNKTFNTSKNFNQNNKYINYHSQQYYPSQPIQQHRSSFNDFNKKKFQKKDKFNMRYPESDMTTNETLMALKSLIQNQNEIKK
ncbi:conserved Plasmodium protein, unknown function [Plasmodium gallinaceum]|uniref:Uncharacterized protein n=1 Tax=Plasmodium gallinaceum TaxID=5849 RepID=A0A1J1GP82_PLAGA|nr:conserved Plasmodium protein, unknown function [Plasmodium gallinaceum]CRG94221.1 conserved Plasmodium protein, unknown function [Plasmodium gallinaceum]